MSYAFLNEDIWKTKKRIKANIDKLVNNGKELALAVQAQGDNDPGGLVDQKNTLLERLHNKFFPVSRQLSFYALDVEDMVMLNDVHLEKNEYKTSGMKDYFTRSATMLKRGREYLVEDPDCEITSEQLDLLEKELEEVRKMPVAVEIVTNERKLATRSIKDINTDARAIFKKLDLAFEGFFSDNEKFLNGWFQVRKIKGLPVKKRKPPKKEKLS